MKIIDILVKIANGEEPPKKIMYDDYIYYFDNKCENYVRDDDIGTSINWDYVAINCLNEEVEILETTITYKPDKIKKFNAFEIEVGIPQEDILNKINEIIEVLNER